MKLRLKQVPRATLASPARHQRLHLGARLVKGRLRFQPADEIQVMAPSTAGVGRIELKRRPYLGRLIAAGRESVSLGHHSYDIEWARVDHNLFSDDVRLPAVSALP